MGDKQNKRYESIYLLHDLIKDFRSHKLISLEQNILKYEPIESGRFPGAFIKLNIHYNIYVPNTHIQTELVGSKISIDKQGASKYKDQYILYFPAENSKCFKLNQKPLDKYYDCNFAYYIEEEDNHSVYLDQILYSTEVKRFYVINLNKESELQSSFTSPIYPYDEEKNSDTVITTEKFKLKPGNIAAMNSDQFDNLKLAQAEKTKTIQFFALISKNKIVIQSKGSLAPKATSLNGSRANIIGIIPKHLQSKYGYLADYED